VATLKTPAPIRKLQRALYLRAKREPRFRAYALSDKVYRPDILAHAYALAKANGGAPGPDGRTFAEIEADGRERLLEELRDELTTKTYRPGPVRRVYIPKLNGGERPLGIPPGVEVGRWRTMRRTETTTWTPNVSSRSRSPVTWVRAQAVRAARSRSSCIRTYAAAVRSTRS